MRALIAISEVLGEVEDMDQTTIFLSHQQVADLSDMSANALDLPPPIPYQLRVWNTGNWNDGSYQLNSEFLDGARSIYLDSRIGSIVTIGRLQYRLTNPIYLIVHTIKSGTKDRDGLLETVAQIRELTSGEVADGCKISPDEAIMHIRIRHVSGFSASIAGAIDDPKVTAVLFAKHMLEESIDNEKMLDESQQILEPAQSVNFNNQFLADKKVKATYVLNSGEYIYFDPSVRLAIAALHTISKSDAPTRRAFIASPNAVLASYIPLATDDPETVVSSVFVETAQFSERVIGINEWKVPELPFLVDEKNEWGTEFYIFHQPGSAEPIMIPKDDLKNIYHDLKNGQRNNEPVVSTHGLKIPVSPELIDAMEEHLTVEPDEPGIEQEKPDTLTEDEKKSIYVVDTLSSFDVINYELVKKTPINLLAFDTPRTLMPSTTLMLHQEIGVRWLINSYNIGMPGVLIADDMGLGKTLQALVFLALYRQQTPNHATKPCLIVAPTGLLGNWLKEIKDHLGETGLGVITEAFGSRLRLLKSGSVSGKDTDHGIPMLNKAQIERADVVLTTYETLRDYQISFASIQFGVVVFDEIQKTKNPKSLISRSATSVNAQFRIGLSGTPVENSLADLWTVMDILVPGLLNFSLKDFMKEFGGNPGDEKTITKLKKLQYELLDSNEEKLAPILRRMKSEVFKDKDMPQKLIHNIEETCKEMPPEQANFYSTYTNMVASRQIKVIEALQAFRKISLSPRKIDRWLDEGQDFVSASARLLVTFELLDKINQANEKTLIFVETREIQPVLAQIVKERYSLRKIPLIINGTISGKARQHAVNEFQNGAPGFDVILISPKAGGVGLTLTAANHVIHLERWWNPAVEDQCNDRAYRIGQKKDVHIYMPLAKHPGLQDDSFDLVLDNILTRKRGLARSLFIPVEVKSEDFSSMFQDQKPPSGFQPFSLEESYEIETGEAFEDYVASSLNGAGFKVRTTKRSWDKGCDLVIEKSGFVILCQCKQVMSEKTLAEGVGQVIASKVAYQGQLPTHLLLVTNALSLSRTMSLEAQKNNVLILNGESVSRYGIHLLSILTD